MSSLDPGALVKVPAASDSWVEKEELGWIVAQRANSRSTLLDDED